MILLLAACGKPAPGPAPATSTPAPSATATYAAPTPTPTVTAVPTVVPTGLDVQGPWLMFVNANGLQAVNASGEGGAVTVFGAQPLQWSVSPRGRTIAALTADNELRQGLALHLITFPGGQSRELTLLTAGSTTPKADSGPGVPDYEIGRAIGEYPSLAWSPDGYQLAFISAFSGDSADVYTYDLRLDDFKHLSNEENQAFSPVWSPGGKFVAYLTVYSFGNGGRMVDVDGWSVRVQDRQKFDLYTVDPKSQGDQILGWRGDHELVIRSYEETCGWFNLRLYRPETMGVTVLQLQSFSEAWFAPGGAVLMNIEALLSEACKVKTAPGLYLFRPDFSIAKQVLPAFNGEVRWLPQLGAFILLNDGQLYQLTVDGERSPLITPYNSLPAISAGGKSWAWANEEGVFSGLLNQPPYKIFDGPAHDALWSPDGSALFFFGQSPTLGSGLFRAAAPSFAPRLVAPLDGTSPAWILP